MDLYRNCLKPSEPQCFNLFYEKSVQYFLLLPRLPTAQMNTLAKDIGKISCNPRQGCDSLCSTPFFFVLKSPFIIQEVE